MAFNIKSFILGAASLGAVLVLMGAAGKASDSFDTITVNRINVVEPDGTVRMVISSRDSLPGVFVKGKEIQHPRPAAGIIFLNDEQTEVGGLGYFGSMQADGPQSGVSMSFDRYQQDQQIQLFGMDSNGQHHAGLIVNDVADGVARPMLSSEDNAAQRNGEHSIIQRMYVGKSPEGRSEIRLADGAGTARLTLQVSPSGEPEIAFLDADGQVLKTITAND